MRFLFASFILSLGLVSCAHNHSVSTAKDEKPTCITEKDLINSTTEKALGEAIFAQILHKEKTLPVSDDFKTYTAEITKNLSEVSNRTELGYEVQFIDSKEFIALGLPGGKIVISKSFLNIIKSESEYANVIANQMAHIAKQHLVQNLLKNSEYAAALKAGTVTERTIQQSIFILTDMGFEENMVNEADRLAPTYAMHAGYDVHGMQNVLTNLGVAMAKNRTYGKSDLSFDMINHRSSMSSVFAKALDTADKKDFPKTEDRFAAMIKKIKPIKKKK